MSFYHVLTFQRSVGGMLPISAAAFLTPAHTSARTFISAGKRTSCFDLQHLVNLTIPSGRRDPETGAHVPVMAALRSSAGRPPDGRPCGEISPRCGPPVGGVKGQALIQGAGWGPTRCEEDVQVQLEVPDPEELWSRLDPESPESLKVDVARSSTSLPKRRG